MKIRVGVFVFEGVLASAVFGIKDIFDICNGYCRKQNEAFFDVHFIGLEKEHEFSTATLELHLIEPEKYYDVVLVPPIIGGYKVEVTDMLKNWLVGGYHQGSLLAAACMGSFVLAHTGLLDYKRATTHWLLEEVFKEQFPQVHLQSEKILIDEGNLITAGGVSAYMDLALYIIEKRLSLHTSNTCASLLLVERGRDSQQCYKDLSSTLLVEDTRLKKLLLWMRNNLDTSLDIKTLAKRMNLNERSFVRLFKKEVKSTPIQYLQYLRVEEAKALLVNSTKSFEQITFEVGFNNESSFRRLFKRETSLNPGEYRQKFKFKA